MRLKIISAEDVIFDGEVQAVHLPGQQGDFTVLQNHASLISILVPGSIRYHKDGQDEQIDIQGGMADVDNNVVSVCIY